MHLCDVDTLLLNMYNEVVGIAGVISRVSTYASLLLATLASRVAYSTAWSYELSYVLNDRSNASRALLILEA